MRKLPSDAEVHTLHQQGISARDIAYRYDVLYPAVHKAIRRHEGREHITVKRAHPIDTSFTRVGAQPVSHRDTGTGTEAQYPSEMDEFEPTELHECRDLLREWRVA